MQRTRLRARRLAADTRLSLITLVSSITVVFILPFAVFRLLEGSYIVAVVDALLVAISVGAMAWAWRSGNTGGPSIVVAVTITAAAIVVPFFIGFSGALWFFPLSVFIFYMVHPWIALILMGLGLVSMLWHVIVQSAVFYNSGPEMVSFLSAATSTVVFSFFFARQARRQKEQLIRWATKDPLTGLYNRRSLDEELKIALATRDRSKGVTRHGLLILDLDNFKQINDQFGHGVGDELLVKLAELIERSTRIEDRAFRYGGDEFVILLTDTDQSGLAQFGEKLVQSVAEELDVGTGIVTASMGAALLSREDTQESWNQRADRCLYTAKEQGRNRLVVAEHSAQPA